MGSGVADVCQFLRLHRRTVGPTHGQEDACGPCARRILGRRLVLCNICRYRGEVVERTYSFPRRGNMEFLYLYSMRLCRIPVSFTPIVACRLLSTDSPLLPFGQEGVGARRLRHADEEIRGTDMDGQFHRENLL